MEPDQNAPRRAPEKSSWPFGSNVALVVITTMLLAVFLSALFFNVPDAELSYADFLRLVRQSAREAPHGAFRPVDPSAEGGPRLTGEIVIERLGSKNEVVFKARYSNLREVRVDDRAITGLIDREVILPASRAGKKAGLTFKTNKLVGSQIDAELTTLLSENNIDWHSSGGPGFWDRYGMMLLLSVLFIGVFWFLVRKLNGAGSPMQFGRSRGKLYAHDEMTVTFNDVAGIDEAVEEVREVVDFLKSPDKYQKLGGRIPKGVLLVGPPGTGKTLLARAIAGEAGVPFFSLSGSDFVEMFVGVGAARVRDLFQQAEAKAPCIIFIDELDALGKSRGASMMGGHDEREQTLNALLVEMDGFDANSGVIVMAATNRPETLDQALLRPGRFDRHVLVDRPDVRGREAILAVHVKNVKLDDSVNLKQIAAITPGFVGADLANLVNEAALLAARVEKSAVGMKEFNEGVERVVAGLEKKGRVMDPDEKQRVAYHESGHALVAYSLPNTDPVHKVSIIPRGVAALGYTWHRPEGDRFLHTQSELESRLQVLLAGTLAEELVYNDISTGAAHDLEQATKIARSMATEYGMSRMGRVNYGQNARPLFLNAPIEENTRQHSEQTAREIDLEVKRLIDEALAKTRQILIARRKALEALTARLIEVESVDAEELRRIVEANSPGPQVVPGTAEALARKATGENREGEAAAGSG